MEAEYNKVVTAALDGALMVKRRVRGNGRVLLVPEIPDYPEFASTNREHVPIGRCDPCQPQIMHGSL